MKVLIPTAGTGSRLGELTRHFNKAMLPVGRRPVISHIMDAYPEGTEFVIALGHKGDYIKQYLGLAYPETKIDFVEVDNFEGPGSGLGYTLRQCRSYLDQEFIFHTNDAIIFDETLGTPMDRDTLFLSASPSNPRKYRTVLVDVEDNEVVQIYDKAETDLRHVFDYIGVAFIKDYKNFVEMLDDLSVEIGETDYFMRSLDKGIGAHFVGKWYDIGDVEQLRLAQRELSDFHNLEKSGETIYFRGSKVYKFFVDESYVQKRVKRASLLGDLVPWIVGVTQNFYEYEYVPGELLSDGTSVLFDFQQLLDWSKKRLWKPMELDTLDRIQFDRTCHHFYYDKTLNRLNSFYSKYGLSDHAETINGVHTPRLTRILEMVNWGQLRQGRPVLFHGDYYFGNILKTQTGFKLLDWRQGFGDEIRYGDLYYDLAKLLHGLIIDDSIIRDEQFTVEVGDQVEFDFQRKHSLIKCEELLHNFVDENGWSWTKVELLAGLVFLNMACLHHHSYSHLLYYLGKLMLWETVWK